MQQPRAVVDDCLCMTPPPLPALDSITVDQALAGDPDAFARLYARYQPLVLQLARGVLVRRGGGESALELTAEVWLRLLERGLLRGFDPARGSFRRFFKMVAWQQALAIAGRWARRRRYERSTPEEPAEPEPPSWAGVETLHHRMVLRRLVERARLSAAECTLLEECLLWQTPARELAGRLGCSVAAVHSHHYRLRVKLARAARKMDGGRERAAA